MVFIFLLKKRAASFPVKGGGQALALPPGTHLPIYGVPFPFRDSEACPAPFPFRDRGGGERRP